MKSVFVVLKNSVASDSHSSSFMVVFRYFLDHVSGWRSVIIFLVKIVMALCFFVKKVFWSFICAVGGGGCSFRKNEAKQGWWAKLMFSQSQQQIIMPYHCPVPLGSGSTVCDLFCRVDKNSKVEVWFVMIVWLGRLQWQTTHVVREKSSEGVLHLFHFLQSAESSTIISSAMSHMPTKRRWVLFTVI